MYNIIKEKQNPIKQLYPTTIWLDWLDIDQDDLTNLIYWAKMQPWQNVGDSYAYTTRKGDQLIPDKPIWEYDNAPAIKKIMPQIQAAADEWIKSYSEQPLLHAVPGFAHFVFYQPGGHQWPHWHKCTWTAILGLRNNGAVLLQDPRPVALSQGHMLIKEVIINPGQLFIAPGYLIHSSAAAEQERDILVFMGD
jgi:hypothetical protein